MCNILCPENDFNAETIFPIMRLTLLNNEILDYVESQQTTYVQVLLCYVPIEVYFYANHI